MLGFHQMEARRKDGEYVRWRTALVHRPTVSGPGPSRGLAVGGTFDAAHTRQTLTEISDAATLPLSTTHRLIAELVASSRPGVRRPLHATGVGKGLRAQADPNLQRHCPENLTRMNPHTIVERNDR